VILVGFGAGLTYGANLVRIWPWVMQEPSHEWIKWDSAFQGRGEDNLWNSGFDCAGSVKWGGDFFLLGPCITTRQFLSRQCLYPGEIRGWSSEDCFPGTFFEPHLTMSQFKGKSLWQADPTFSLWITWTKYTLITIFLLVMRHWKEQSQEIILYNFYYADENGARHLVGILPERRHFPRRITRQSVMNRWRKVVGNVLMQKGHRVYYETAIHQ